MASHDMIVYGYGRLLLCSAEDIDQKLDGVEYAKCEDRNLLIVLNSEKLADYNSGCCQEVLWSIYFYTSPP